MPEPDVFQAAEQRVALLMTTLDDARAEVIDRFTAFASDWIDRLVQQSIQDRASRASELGVEGLRGLKGAINQVKANVPSDARLVLADDHVWPDRSLNPRTVGSSTGYWPEFGRGGGRTSAFDQALRRVLGAVATPLIEYGFAEPGIEGPWGDPPYAWRYALEYSPELLTAMNRYHHVLTVLSTAQADLDEARKAKEAAEAASLWEQA
jgi:hypothetical protein